MIFGKKEKKESKPKKVLIADDQEAWRNFNSQAVYSILGEKIYIDAVSSAKEAYDKIFENFTEPYDFILTDMQMEDEYLPKMAGEWLIEQVKPLPQYLNTKIIIISAAMNIERIAENYSVDYIRKATAAASIDSYAEILNPTP